MVVLLAACGGSTPAASHSPAVSASSASTSTPTGGATAAPTASPAGPAPLVQCAVAVPAGDNLAIGMVVGDPTVVVRDIQDPANAKNLCSFSANVVSPGFVNATTVSYATSDHQIVSAPLTGGSAAVWASYTPGFGSGQFAFSPDGRAMSYLDGNAWHLVNASGNRVLTTLPAVPGRGVDPDQDDSFLGFSPDGQYLALFQTFHTGGSGATAPDQIRKAGDGSLVYSTSGMRMAVWASVPSRLFFRDASGNVHRWDPTAGLSSMTSIQWIRPRSSPDGRWIAYTFRTPSGAGGVGFYSVQSNSVANTSPPGRSGQVFLSNDLVWYAGEKPCTANCGLQQVTPTGVTYIYSIAGASEITSRLATVYDAWPHQTAPGI